MSVEEIKTEEQKQVKASLSWSKFWQEFWRLLAPAKKLFIVSSVIVFIAIPFEILKPYILKLLIDGFSSLTNDGFGDLFKLILLYLLSDQARSVVQYFADRKILHLLVEVEYFLNVKAQEKLIFLNLGYHEKENTGAKVIKVEKGIGKISNFIENIFWEVMPTIFQLIFTVAALFYADWRIALSFLLIAPSFIVVTYYANKRMYPVRKEIYAGYEKANGKMVQSILNINAVQSFVQEDRELSSFELTRRNIRDNEDKQWSWMMKVGLGRKTIIVIGRACVLFLGVYLVFKGTMTVGSLVFALSLSESAYQSLYRMMRFYDRIEEGREGVSRLMELFNDEDGLEKREKSFTPKKIEGEISFNNVSFRYSEGKEFALNKVNLKIVPGAVTALVGPSGGGKTTIARLIYRHYDPQEGQVSLDGRDLRDYDLRGFRRFMAIVPQEVEIFDLTVAENIAYAKPEASLKEIKAAAKIANADSFIERLEKGYNTIVGERGIKLSGGQRQRIGIARAVLANPRVLIFDEATSNLDSESERLIQLAMQKISRGRTMIIIAHRFSTIASADKIVVLEKGKVVESGSHVELANIAGGLYSKLSKLQMSGEIK